MRIVSFPEAAVPVELRRQVVALQDLAWPPDVPSGLAPWHDPALQPVSVLLLEGDSRVVAALDIVSKELTHRGVPYRASGISAMVTDPELRRRGYGRVLATRAREMIEADGADLGIFTCDPPLQAFYESAGWEHLPGTTIVGGTPQDPFPSDRLQKVTMGAFFSPEAERRRSGFLGTRVELYPGAIDRLW